jgi:metal-responsive CopG/Arc/MetJ family transcriptional regulator
MRTIVDLPDEQIKALKQICESTQLSRAELVRRAIAEYLVHHRCQAEDHAFGLWKRHKKEALRYQEELRAEWAE